MNVSTERNSKYDEIMNEIQLLNENEMDEIQEFLNNYFKNRKEKGPFEAVSEAVFF